MPRNKKPLARAGLTVMLREEIEIAKPVIESLGWVLPPKSGVPWVESRFSFEVACCWAALSTEKGPPIVSEYFSKFEPAFHALTFFLKLSLKNKTLRDAAASTASLDRFHKQTDIEKNEWRACVKTTASSLRLRKRNARLPYWLHGGSNRRQMSI